MINFYLLIPYIIILIVSIPLSFLFKGLVNKFLKEEELYEKYLEEHKEELEGKLTKEQKKNHKESIKKLKVKFKPAFSIAFIIINTILISLLYYIVGNCISFYMYAFLTFLLEIAFYTDLKACIIPDEINYFGIGIGIIYTIYMLITQTKVGLDLLMGGVCAFLLFVMIGGIAYLILKKEGMGGGDIKLVTAIGFILGLTNFVQVFVLSFLFAAVISIFLLLLRIKKRQDYIPLGPFICLATYITMLIPAMTTATFLFKLSLGIL
ncbi:MAG: prepilin peptidase [Clostridia bacterium]|nr:prepilin peptidase [Clostridia bacterium]